MPPNKSTKKIDVACLLVLKINRLKCLLIGQRGDSWGCRRLEKLSRGYFTEESVMLDNACLIVVWLKSVFRLHCCDRVCFCCASLAPDSWGSAQPHTCSTLHVVYSTQCSGLLSLFTRTCAVKLDLGLRQWLAGLVFTAYWCKTPDRGRVFLCSKQRRTQERCTLRELVGGKRHVIQANWVTHIGAHLITPAEGNGWAQCTLVNSDACWRDLMKGRGPPAEEAGESTLTVEELPFY